MATLVTGNQNRLPVPKAEALPGLEFRPLASHLILPFMPVAVGVAFPSFSQIGLNMEGRPFCQNSTGRAKPNCYKDGNNYGQRIRKIKNT